MLSTREKLIATNFPPLHRAELDTLQVNLGYRCNQQCLHCHVNAGPKRTETMSAETADQVIEYLRQSSVTTLDITGGAPELNDCFRGLVERATALGKRVIDRCNLTILEEAGQEDLAEFLANHKVEVVASMPCYLQENVDRQRGKGVFDSSILGLKKLNELGYGQPDSDLILNLVYNPQGAVLPPPQLALQSDFKQRLHDDHGIVFNQLFTLTNMPILRFGSMLLSKGEFESYMSLLRSAHLDANLDGVMCRTLVSIDYKGFLFDCDFNQMLEMPLIDQEHKPRHISSLTADALDGQPILIADHCYGCTAGQGSSCGGALE